MKTLDDLVAEAQASIREIMPWDLEEQLQTDGTVFEKRKEAARLLAKLKNSG